MSLKQLVFACFLLGCVCGFGTHYYSGLYGGWGGRSFFQVCPAGSYVDQIQLRTGQFVDAVRVHCAGQGWQHWSGGNGGSVSTMTATREFCGFGVRFGRLVDRLCLRDATGHEQCHGGHGGRWATQNFCLRGQPSSRALIGIRGRSGLYVDSLQFVFEDRTSCLPSKNDWSCCSADSPCGIGEGDCDRDADCMGRLVCQHNVGRQHGAQSGGFDVCGLPPRGRLLQEEEVEEEQEDVPEAEGCHVFDDQEECENGESCVFFIPPMEMFDTLSSQGRLFSCWNMDDCVPSEAGQMTCA